MFTLTASDIGSTVRTRCDKPQFPGSPVTTIPPENTDPSVEHPPARPSDAPSLVDSKPRADNGSGRSHTPWTVRADLDLVRLRSALTALDAVPTKQRRPADQLHRTSAGCALDAAQEVLDGYRRQAVLRRWLTSSACYTAVLAQLQAAAEELVYCQPAETLLSRLPGSRPPYAPTSVRPTRAGRSISPTCKTFETTTRPPTLRRSSQEMLLKLRRLTPAPTRRTNNLTRRHDCVDGFAPQTAASLRAVNRWPCFHSRMSIKSTRFFKGSTTLSSRRTTLREPSVPSLSSRPWR
jgi:hypothetical protein